MKVITTVGTSIFENYRDYHNNIDDDYELFIDKPARDWDNWSERINKVKRAVAGWATDNDYASAEIKSLFKIKSILNVDIEVFLLATDTILSKMAAEILREVLDGRLNVFFSREDVISGLQVEDRKTFEKIGLVNLISRVYEIINCQPEKACLNITGGYKAVIPYMTVLGQINNMPLYYIFENTDELIKLPQVPIQINWNMFAKYSHVLQELDHGIAGGWEDYKRRNAVGEDFSACIWEDEDMAGLNAMGSMFWQRYKNFTCIVDILIGSRYSDDSKGNKNRLNRSILELHNRLTNYISNNGFSNTDEIINAIKKLPEKDDLRHGPNPDKDKFVFKSTNDEHIRLVYSLTYQNNNLRLKIYDYVRGGFDHGKYLKDFKDKMAALKNEEFVTIPLK